MRKFIVLIIASLVCATSFAQVDARFEVRNGVTYAVITNYGSYPAFVAWRCVNYQLGQYRDGSINLQGGYETVVGPNIGWIWQPGEQFLFQVGNNQHNVTFKGTVKSSCNISSHDCSGGVDANHDGWCDICEANGFNCHMVKHQPKQPKQ